MIKDYDFIKGMIDTTWAPIFPGVFLGTRNAQLLGGRFLFGAYIQILGKLSSDILVPCGMWCRKCWLFGFDVTSR